MKYICLTQYTHIRCTAKYTYIANFSKGNQLVYDLVGGDWLFSISHTPCSIQDIINSLSQGLEEDEKQELKKDYIEFVESLSNEGFVSIGNTIQETLELAKEDIIWDQTVPPITDLTLELTNKCNERCVHCYIPHKKKEQGVFMPKEKIKEWIDEFYEMGGTSVTLTGGEVFLHPHLSEILKYINHKSLKIAIYSNLIGLTSEFFILLQELNIYLIQVSLYDINEQIHDSITNVSGSCSKTKKAIEQLKKLGFPVKIACPAMKENRHGVIQVLKYAKELDIPIDLELNITPREDQSKDNLEHRLNINEMEVLLDELMNYDPKFTIHLLHRHKIQYTQEFNLADYLNYPLCTAGNHGLYITAKGNVSTCPNLQGFNMGNVFHSKIQEIWENNVEINKIRNITEGCFEKCINCEAADFCFRCFARNYTETGSLTKIPSYACDAAFLSKKIINKYRQI